jgi:hypothetical protein
MKRFTTLYITLDETTKTTGKVEALKRYFAEAPPDDAAWALCFLIGDKIKQNSKNGPPRRQASRIGFSTNAMRRWAMWQKRSR